MPTPRGGGIFKGSSNSTKAKPPVAPPSVHEDDLLPERCTSPSQQDTYQEALTLCKQHLASASSSPSRGNSSDNSSGQQDAAQPDSALMDFWVLLQQTQSNLQVSVLTDACILSCQHCGAERTHWFIRGTENGCELFWTDMSARTIEGCYAVFANLHTL